MAADDDGRIPVKESEVGTEADVPHAWVISIDSMSIAKAREIGRILGQNGVHGHFLDGSMATNINRYAKWRQAQRGKGGE